MTQPSPSSADLRLLHGANVRRLMAQLNLTQSEVVSATGLDERTVRSILQGDSQPHARTLHKLAEGLGVEVDELFQDPYQSGNHNTRYQNTRNHAVGNHKVGNDKVDNYDFNHEFSSAAFDRATNPVAAEVVDSHPKLFEDWTPTDFDELFSRMAVGGELTEAGTLTVVRSMNERRKLMQQVAVVLESSEGDLMRDFIQLLYRRATTID